LVLLFNEFLHLGGEGDVGEEKAAVLMIVAIFLSGITG
jgi:hypothetical protein